VSKQKNVARLKSKDLALKKFCAGCATSAHKVSCTEVGYHKAREK